MSQRTEFIRAAKGSILVGLLWCLALLSVVVVGVLHSANLDLLVVKNHGDSIQAHYLALAGIEKAKALLHRDAADRKRSARHHSGELYNAPESFRDVSLGRGHFRVIRQGRRDEGGKIVFGVSDEESRLNVNQASADELKKIYGMTPDVVAAILDWRDSDNEVTPGGAEAEYYASLQPPYFPRNGPLRSTRELLMIRGVSRELFMGEDANQNGLLDPEEDNRDGMLDAGWSGIVTVDSSVQNRNAAGEERVDIKSADERSLVSVRGLTPELANAIVAYRGQKQFDSLADLLDVTALIPQNPPSSQQNRPANQPGLTAPRSSRAAPAQETATAKPSGPRLIGEDLLIEIADDLTTGSGEDQPGAVNINTASVDVLACLPGISQELAQAIVSYRKSAGFFPNIAGLLKVDGMTRESFKQAAPRVCARSETFRILSEGTVTSTGARRRIQVIVRVSPGDVETLSYREDL